MIHCISELLHSLCDENYTIAYIAHKAYFNDNTDTNSGLNINANAKQIVHNIKETVGYG